MGPFEDEIEKRDWKLYTFVSMILTLEKHSACTYSFHELGHHIFGRDEFVKEFHSRVS